MSLMDEALMLDAESGVVASKACKPEAGSSLPQQPGWMPSDPNGAASGRSFTVVERIRALNLGMQVMLGREPLSFENIAAMAPLTPDEWAHLILAMIARSERGAS